MKSIKTLSLFMLTAFGLSLAPVTAGSTLTYGLLTYYPCRVNTHGYSGNGNTLTDYGASLTCRQFGGSYLSPSVSTLNQNNNEPMTACINPKSFSSKQK